MCQNLEEFNKRFVIQEKLGEGTYGIVYKAMDLKRLVIVAIKQIRDDIDEYDEGVP